MVMKRIKFNDEWAIEVRMEAETIVQDTNTMLRAILADKRQSGEMKLAGFIRLSGITESFVTSWVKGVKHMERLSTIVRACKALGVKIKFTPK